MRAVVIGGSGFIGTYLVRSLLTDERIASVRLLTRGEQTLLFEPSSKLEIVVGDAMNKASLRELILEQSVVINLTYLTDVPQSRNIEFVSRLIEVCRENKIKKLIHCSTAVVSGRTNESPLTETSAAHPYSDYERTKLLLENLILENSGSGFECLILRPTAVFGPGGRNLLKLANDLCFGSRFKNYLKSCLYGSRTMNLVSVENVVSALSFLIFNPNDLDRQVFIVADDDQPGNRYGAVETTFMKILDIPPYPLPRLFLPKWVLKSVLKGMGQSNTDPDRRYGTPALEQLGWRKAADFEQKIEDFALWFKNQHSALSNRSSV